jgi:hypothetical protein
VTTRHELDLLAGAIEAAGTAVASASGVSHHLPTPCRRWDLGVLVRHVADSAGVVHELLAGEPPGPPPLPGCSAAQAALRELGDLAAGAARDDPGSALPALLGSYEFAVHAWDISEAVGSRTSIPGPLATSLLVSAPVVLAVGRRTGLFGPELEPEPGQGDLARLLSLFGRTDAWRRRL